MTGLGQTATFSALYIAVGFRLERRPSTISVPNVLICDIAAIMSGRLPPNKRLPLRVLAV
jgi:hypothetical protein